MESNQKPRRTVTWLHQWLNVAVTGERSSGEQSQSKCVFCLTRSTSRSFISKSENFHTENEFSMHTPSLWKNEQQLRRNWACIHHFCGGKLAEHEMLPLVTNVLPPGTTLVTGGSIWSANLATKKLMAWWQFVWFPQTRSDPSSTRFPCTESFFTENNVNVSTTFLRLTKQSAIIPDKTISSVNVRTANTFSIAQVMSYSLNTGSKTTQ